MGRGTLSGCPFLLVLIGFEELGKLLEMLQAAALAERDSTQEVEVRSFRDQGAKSAHSAKVSLSSEYLQRGLKLVGWPL